MISMSELGLYTVLDYETVIDKAASDTDETYKTKVDAAKKKIEDAGGIILATENIKPVVCNASWDSIDATLITYKKKQSM